MINVELNDTFDPSPNVISFPAPIVNPPGTFTDELALPIVVVPVFPVIDALLSAVIETLPASDVIVTLPLPLNEFVPAEKINDDKSEFIVKFPAVEVNVMSWADVIDTALPEFNVMLFIDVITKFDNTPNVFIKFVLNVSIVSIPCATGYDKK